MDTPLVPDLPATLAAELERPREVSAQVVNHLLGTYGIDREAIGAFLVNELPKLEDYEIDLILAPLFTPTLRDQAVFAGLLGQDSVPVSRWPGLVQQLVARPTRAQLVTADGQTRAVPLRDVTLERFVHRLRLDATIPGPLFQSLGSLPSADQPLLKAIARRAVWGSDARREIFSRYVTRVWSSAFTRPAPPEGGTPNAPPSVASPLDDAVGLLKLAETYEPADLSDLLARIPLWLQTLRQDINTGTGAKPFFNERVEELHGGGRDQRRQDNSRVNAKEHERAFLERLQRVLAG